MKKLNKDLKLKDCWVWSDDITQKVKSFMFGKTLNVPCGLSKLGNIRGDIDPQEPDIIKMDMNDLPYPDDSFDCVIQDPPWKINFFHRQKPFFEAVRVCKVGGRIIYNCTWMPTSKYVKLEDKIIRVDKNWAMVSIIWIFKKTGDIPKK